MTHVFRLMALSWLALAVQWAGVNQWGHAAVTALVGVACYAAGEHYATKPIGDPDATRPRTRH